MKLLNNLAMAGGLLLAIGGSVTAQAATIDFTTSTNAGTLNQWTVEGITATAKAWTVYNQGTGPVGATLQRWAEGLGVKNSKDGVEDTLSHYHSIDNRKGIDYIKLDFSEEVKIEQIVLSIWRNDGDMTLGFGDDWKGNLTNIDWSGTRTGTWTNLTLDLKALGFYNGLEFDDQWRIFARLCGTNSSGDYCSGNDGFKLRSVTVSAVPIPAAVWLFGSALLGVIGVGYRRRGIKA